MQEEVPIEYVNKLIDRGILLTPQIPKNIVDEIKGTELAINWVTRFRKRHGDCLFQLVSTHHISSAESC